MSQRVHYCLERRQSNKLIVIILFAIYPIIALPFILIEISYKKKYAFILLALFLGYLGLLYPPFGDFYHYAEDYELYSLCSYDELMEVLTLKLKMDKLFPIFLWTLGKLHIPSDFGRFITTFISFLLLFSILYDIVKKTTVSRTETLYYVFALICFFPFYNFIQRYCFSLSLFVFATYRLFFYNKIKYIIFIVIACLNHFAFLVPSIVLAFFIISKLKFSRNIIPWLMLLSFVFSFDILTPLISLLPIDAYVAVHLFEYIDGFWANDYVSENTLFFQIYYILGKAGFYFCCFFIYTNYRNTIWERFIVYLLILLLFCSPFKGVYDRYFSIATMVMFIDVILYMSENSIKSKTETIFKMICVLLFVINLWGVRRQLSVSEERLIFAPSYFILTHTYDSNWRHRTLDSEGNLP